MAYKARWSILLTALISSVAMGQLGTKLTQGIAPYGKGFVALEGMGHSGGVAFLCENLKPDEARGVRYSVDLNQDAARAFVVSAWSKAENVSGSADGGYSLYLDLQYMDGGHLWGSIASFASGTHGWQLRKVRIVPIKPVKQVLVYLLLRGHTGKAWFSDATIAELGSKGSFDYQPIKATHVLTDGWYIRDDAQNSNLIPASEGKKLGLAVQTFSNGDSRKISVVDRRKIDRALTLYFCEKVDAVGGKWWNTIRSAIPIAETECGTLTSISSGANGLTSLYPFAAITTARFGRMLAVPPSIGPRPVRIFYDPALRVFCAAFDVALTTGNRIHPSAATAEVLMRSIDPEWGFRDAARQYYLAYPEAFRNRMPKQGIWIPFTDPAKIPHPEDFGISVHEGDNSVLSDSRLGILGLRYTEPMTWWMNMAPAIPRTYESALKVLNQNLSSPDKQTKRQAEAVISSGTIGPDGRYNLSFENQPWANGAVWVLNPNPALARSGGKHIEADVDFDLAEAKVRYATTPLSGEYLDSIEAHADVLDYRKESIAASSLPPSFDTETRRPVIPQSYSTYEIARLMSTWLHAKGKFLMANTTPVSNFCYEPLLDCSGIEVNWLDGGAWTPDGDDVFCYRRTLSYQKPYMLLQNTDFSKFGPKEVAMYFKKCLFYDVFPSFFSADASTHPYWEDPALYNRDRPLFQSIIPLIRMLSSAGWEPVTKAHTSNASVLIERYGEKTWTLFNEGSSDAEFTVRFDKQVGAVSAKEYITGKPIKLERNGGRSKLTAKLAPGDCLIVRLQ